MKVSEGKFFKGGRRFLPLAALASVIASCGHWAPVGAPAMPVYQMPAATVVQTPPVMLSSASNPMTVSRVTPSMGQVSGQGPDPSAMAAMPSGSPYPVGATVIRQAPITVHRPAIMINQPPVWVGSPPVPIGQPPVLVRQPPIVYHQPGIVLHPPKVEFQGVSFTPPESQAAPQAAQQGAPQESYTPPVVSRVPAPVTPTMELNRSLPPK